jgi:hypothetical protein
MSATTPVDPASLATTEDAGRALGHQGGDWEHAIELGIDVTLLERNLGLSPAERLRLADEHLRLANEIQARTVPEAVRVGLARARLTEKLAALGVAIDGR